MKHDSAFISNSQLDLEPSIIFIVNCFTLFLPVTQVFIHKLGKKAQFEFYPFPFFSYLTYFQDNEMTMLANDSELYICQNVNLKADTWRN